MWRYVGLRQRAARFCTCSNVPAVIWNWRYGSVHHCSTDHGIVCELFHWYGAVLRVPSYEAQSPDGLTHYVLHMYTYLMIGHLRWSLRGRRRPFLVYDGAAGTVFVVCFRFFYVQIFCTTHLVVLKLICQVFSQCSAPMLIDLSGEHAIFDD